MAHRSHRPHRQPPTGIAFLKWADLRLKETVRPYYLRWVYFTLNPAARPASFIDCWRFPSWDLDSKVLLEFSAGRENLDILFFPMNDWHFRMQRSQHLACELARRGHRCIYLNPHFGRQFPNVRRRGSEARLAQIAANVFEFHVRLPAEPVFHHRPLTDQESRAISDAVLRLARTIRIRHAIQIVSFPVWSQAAADVRSEAGFPIVYDCHDLLSGFADVSPRLVEREEQLMDDSDVVLFSSRRLAEVHTRANPALAQKQVLVPNAVDPLAFQPAPGIRGAGAPVAGYAGAIEDWFDAEMIEAAAAGNPECAFWMIGRDRARAAHRLRAGRNIFFFGEIPYALLPGWMSRFSIGLLPFTRNGLTEAASPLKVYEYFSCGLPVVSTRLPEMEAFGDLVYLADGPSQFAAQVRRALQEDNPTLRRRRRELASRENWSARVDLILEHVQAHAGPRAQGAPEHPAETRQP